MKVPCRILILLLTASAAIAQTRRPDVGGIMARALNLPGMGQDVTRVRVEGMKTRSEHEVLELLGGRLAHVRASPASAPRADDAAFLLRQTLRKDGHADAEVDWRIAGKNEIVLTVREGVRLSLGRVTVNGVPDDERRRFARLYARPAERNRPLIGGPPPFREEDVETGLANLRQEFNARGYWTAEAVLTSRETHPGTGAVDLIVEINPGPLHTIGNPRVTGSDGRGVDLTTKVAEPFAGRRATTRNLNAMRLAVEEAVTSQGYPDADIRMGRTLEGGRFVPEFSINLGSRVKLGRIRIEGLDLTNPERVASRMAGMEGDWYDEVAMNQRLRSMFATGAFASARIETTPVGEGVIDATLHFDEARAKEVSLAAGFGSYQGVIARITYADRNLFGNLWGLNSGFELSSRGVLGEVRITDPWLFGSDVSGTARAFALMFAREGYDSYETGFDGKLTWRFGDHYSVDVYAGNSVVKLTGDGLPSSQLGERLYVNPKLRFTQTLDFRNNRVLPQSGWHLENPLEFGSAIGDVSTSYVKAGLSAGWYHEISRRYQVGFGGEWGMLVPSGDGGDLPIDLRLFNGGARSVRSFPERELGPTFDGWPTGGEAMWNTNLELIREISGPVRGVVFFDAGTLARHHEDFTNSDIELAAGLGIRLNLPIGPVRVEYGYNLTRDEGEPSGTFHFAIGHAF